jgi:hypothetical protein
MSRQGQKTCQLTLADATRPAARRSRAQTPRRRAASAARPLAEAGASRVFRFAEKAASTKLRPFALAALVVAPLAVARAAADAAPSAAYWGSPSVDGGAPSAPRSA